MTVFSQYARTPLVLPKTGYIRDGSLQVDAPMWHPDLSISPFNSKSPNSLPHTVVGAAWAYSQGWSMDGIDDYITTPSNPVLNLAGAFSLEVWFNHPSAEGGDSVTPIAVKGTYFGAQSNYYIIVYGDTRVFCDVWTSGVRKSLEASPTGGGAIAMAINNHIVFGYDGSNLLNIHINGVFNTSKVIGAVALDTDGSALRLGRDDNSFGKVNIISSRLYNRNLSTAECAYNYYRTKWRAGR